MSPIGFLVAVSVILAVASVGVSLFSVWRAQMLVVTADERAVAARKEYDASTQSLRDALERMATQLRDLRPETTGTGLPGNTRPGLNLSKRSQVLRMHRKGDPPDRIAAALSVPLQEVDLLIKVHRIVIKSM